MARQATLRQKSGYWFSEAGGKARRYGRCDAVPYDEALRQFREALAEPERQRDKDRRVGHASISSPDSRVANAANERTNSAEQEPITVASLRDRFLTWLERHRSQRTHYERSRHLLRFCEAHGNRLACEVKAEHLDAFLAKLARRGVALDFQHKHEVSVRAMFRWGVKHGLLPGDYRPFATVEPIRLPAKALLEGDLPTPKEVQAIITHATPSLAALLRVQYATGARTGELLKARVGDFQPGLGQLILARHKREKTMREPRPRVITLNADAVAIVTKLCQGRPADAPLFLTPTGKRWSDKLMSFHFINARDKAKLRETLLPYSLRHLWISEMLMAGIDVLLVARMAGTSVAMIERVYGHFRSQSFVNAQARLDASRKA